MSQGYCPSCQIHAAEDVCFVCGGTMLYGIPLHLTASHSYEDQARGATVGGQTVWITEAVDSII